MSETDRKRHFLDYLGATSPDLANAAKELRGPLMKRVCHTLAISTGTAKRWTDVEVFKKRAERLGLGLPPEHTSRRLSGEKGDGWILAVAPLTDEELRQYWPVLIGANAPSIRKLEKKLADCTSTRQRAELAAELFSTLHPTLRAITQTKADQDRGKANRIRMHGAGLMKLSLEFAELAKQYPDVGATLVSLYEVLQKFLADSTEDIQHERTA